jgi:hypothetical protein
MSQCSSATAAQQSSVQTQIAVAVAKKAQDATKLQGQAATQALTNAAQSVKSPDLGNKFDAAG